MITTNKHNNHNFKFWNKSPMLEVALSMFK